MNAFVQRASRQMAVDFGAGFLQGAVEAPRLFVAPVLAAWRWMQRRRVRARR